MQLNEAACTIYTRTCKIYTSLCQLCFILQAQVNWNLEPICELMTNLGDMSTSILTTLVRRT